LLGTTSQLFSTLICHLGDLKGIKRVYENTDMSTTHHAKFLKKNVWTSCTRNVGVMPWLCVHWVLHFEVSKTINVIWGVSRKSVTCEWVNAISVSSITTSISVMIGLYLFLMEPEQFNLLAQPTTTITTIKRSKSCKYQHQSFNVENSSQHERIKTTGLPKWWDHKFIKHVEGDI